MGFLFIYSIFLELSCFVNLWFFQLYNQRVGLEESKGWSNCNALPSTCEWRCVKSPVDVASLFGPQYCFFRFYPISHFLTLTVRRACGTGSGARTSKVRWHRKRSGKPCSCSCNSVGTHFPVEELFFFFQTRAYYLTCWVGIIWWWQVTYLFGFYFYYSQVKLLRL